MANSPHSSNPLGPSSSHYGLQLREISGTVETFFVYNEVTYKATYTPPNQKPNSAINPTYMITKAKIENLAKAILSNQPVEEIKTHEYQAKLVLNNPSLSQVTSIVISSKKAGSNSEFTQLSKQQDLTKIMPSLLSIVQAESARPLSNISNAAPNTAAPTASGSTNPQSQVQSAPSRAHQSRAPTPHSSTSLSILQTFPGLNNTGFVDCWANALLQMIVTVPNLATAICAVGTHYASNGNAQEKSAGRALNEQIQLLTQSRNNHSNTTTADSRKLRNALVTLGILKAPLTSWAWYNWFMGDMPGQEDALEILRKLLTKYEGIQPTGTDLAHLPGSFKEIRCKHYSDLGPSDKNQNSPLYEKDGSTEAFSTLDADNGQRTEVIERFMPLNLSPLEEDLATFAQALATPSVENQQREKELFTQLLEHYFNPQTQDNEPHDFMIGGYGRSNLRKCQTTREEVRFSSPPDEFIMTIHRFAHTGVPGEVGRKLKHNNGSEIKAPLFERFTLSADYTGSEDTSYEVDSFVVQTGELNSGHYYSYQKIEGQWYLFDDTTVSRAKADEVKEQLQLSYFQHYKKMQTVDQSALRIPAHHPE